MSELPGMARIDWSKNNRKEGECVENDRTSLVRVADPWRHRGCSRAQRRRCIHYIEVAFTLYATRNEHNQKINRDNRALLKEMAQPTPTSE